MIKISLIIKSEKIYDKENLITNKYLFYDNK